jgi:GTP cyclohydrolase I
MLLSIGEDADREGLVKTPARVARALGEMTAGYRRDIADVLSTTFESEGYDEMVVLREVDFFSLCEHHMLPFYGTATVAYIPDGRVAGLSKLARLVDAFARRLQIQERMTKQVGEALEEHLKPRGWGVAIKAKHLCMAARGVGKQRSEMVTTALGGLFKEDAKAREEFLRIASI